MSGKAQNQNLGQPQLSLLPRFRKWHEGIPFRIVFLVPFVALLVFVTGLVGYISFRNGQRAVNDVACQLNNEIASRIEDHLLVFLNKPHQVNQIIANELHQGVLDANEPDVLERLFWEQIQVFESLTSIYFGNPAGGLVDAGREGVGGFLYVIVTDNFVSGPFRKYATDEQGNRTKLLTAVPDFDARERSWYTKAVETGEAVWSDPYILFTGQDMAISASRPVYDQQGNLLGVIASDIFLSHLSDFLQDLEIGHRGQSFIMESSGLLIASSTGESPFLDAQDGTQKRIYASESGSPTIRFAVDYLEEKSNGYQNIYTESSYEFEAEGQRYYLKVTPIQDEVGIDWLAVVVIPASDFMTRINANNRITRVLIVASSGLILILGIFFAGRVTEPIVRLKEAAQALATGEWRKIEQDTSIREIKQLNQAFNDMINQLKEATQRLKTEITEHKRTSQALRERERKYRSLFEQTNDAVFLLDLKGNHLDVNQRATKMLGYEHDELIEMNYERIVDPDELSDSQNKLDLLLGGQTHRPYKRIFRRKNGSTFPVEINVELVRDDSGAPLHIQSLARDITKRMQTQQKLKAYSDNLEVMVEERTQKLEQAYEKIIRQEQLAMLGQMAGGISHELRNPLGVISNLSYLLKLNLDDPGQEVAEALALLDEEIHRADRIITKLLTLAQTGKTHPQPVSIPDLVAGVFTKHPAPEGVMTEICSSDDLSLAYVDPDHFRMVLANLISNAYQAMPEGGALTVSADVHQGEIEVSVSDTGGGITPDIMKKIFEPLFTTKEKGIGLGLAVSKKLVEANQGKIEVESQPEKGTTFILTLPLYENQEK